MKIIGKPFEGMMQEPLLPLSGVYLSGMEIMVLGELGRR
jgi:hypothetical protein